MEENQFDVIILGTGLVESITAAALSKAGYRVAHVDSNSYYGGDQASLSVEEIVQWVDEISLSSDSNARFQRASRSSNVPSQSRQYSICLQPAVLPSVGPFISSLISSGVSKYTGFRLVDCVSVYGASGRVNSVPGSKEDVFKSKEIGLIEKRRLMRFLTFTAGDYEDTLELEGKHDMPFIEFLKTVFSLSDTIASTLAYALAFCASPSEPTLSILHRLRRYLRSAGRYGTSPFLIGHYGCIGELTQGFCRAAAVSGGVYILGKQIMSVNRATKPAVAQETPETIGNPKPTFTYNVKLEEFPDTLECNLLISSPSYIPDALRPEISQLASQDEVRSDVLFIVRCIAIIDQPLSFRSPQEPEFEQLEGPAEGEPSDGDSQPTPVEMKGVDTGILVFPPSSVQGGSSTHAATILINGEGSLSTPKGKWLLYIALPLDQEPDESISPQTLLKPYLDALLSLSVEPSQDPISPLFTTFYLERVLPSSPSPSGENKTYLVPAPLPFAPLPDLADIATTLAERTFVEAIKVLRTIRKLDDDDGEDIVFWPPLPRNEEEEDVEW